MSCVVMLASSIQREETQGDDGIMRAKVRRSQVTIDAETKDRLEKEQAAIESMKPMSEEELAEARSTLIDHMQPRETVMQAMARLSAKPSKRAPQVRLGSQQVTSYHDTAQTPTEMR